MRANEKDKKEEPKEIRCGQKRAELRRKCQTLAIATIILTLASMEGTVTGDGRATAWRYFYDQRDL